MIKHFILCTFIISFSSRLIAMEWSYVENYKEDPSYKELNIESLKSKFKTKELSVFNIHSKRVESYNGFDFPEILQEFYGPNWRTSFAYVIVANDKYESFIQTYKFKERVSLLAFERSDQKSFTSILNYGDKVVELAPAHLVWKENYKKNAKQKASKRKHHWPYGVIGVRQIKSLPKKLHSGVENPNDKYFQVGLNNFIDQCIHCHKLHGVGGLKAGELTRISHGEKKAESGYINILITLSNLTRNPKWDYSLN